MCTRFDVVMVTYKNGVYRAPIPGYIATTKESPVGTHTDIVMIMHIYDGWGAYQQRGHLFLHTLILSW